MDVEIPCVYLVALAAVATLGCSDPAGDETDESGETVGTGETGDPHQDACDIVEMLIVGEGYLVSENPDVVLPGVPDAPEWGIPEQSPGELRVRPSWMTKDLSFSGLVDLCVFFLTVYWKVD